MIVCRSRKFIFLRVPKTGSTSISYHFVENIKFSLQDFYTEMPTASISSYNITNPLFAKDQHPNLQRFVKWGLLTDSMIASCKVYGVLRNPIDRFFSNFTSIISHIKNIDVSNIHVNDIATEALKLLEKSDNHLIHVPGKQGYVIPCMPQSHWLIYNGAPIEGIILYDNLNHFAKKMTGKKMNIKMNVGAKVNHENQLAKEIIAQIHRWYGDDFALWSKFTGKIARS